MNKRTEDGALARRAQGMLKRLDAQGFLDGIAFTQADVDNLNAISAGLPVAGAPNILSAMRLKADYLAQKPAQRVDMRAVHLEILDPYALPPAERPALSPATAVDPDRPRNLAEVKRQEAYQAAAVRLAQAQQRPALARPADAGPAA